MIESRDIIVIGASAGGIEACQRLLRLLPSDFPASVFVVVHLAPQAPSVLAKILGRCSSMEVTNPLEGQPILLNKVYVASSDYHLTIEPGIIHVTHGAAVNGSRPSVDTLFRSAAAAYRERVAGIILSGALSDGTVGLKSIKKNGGIAIVQKPAEAAFSGMPRSAIEGVDVDYILGLEEIAALLNRVGRSEQPA